MYVNIGAYVDEGTLIDSHALVDRARRSAVACT
jgi:tetrahydrodipicolinate N-succinyltransferase